MAKLATHRPEIANVQTPSRVDYRAAVVAAARSQLDVTDPTPYWLAVHGAVPVPAKGKRIHWCGALALWALREAGLVDWKWSFNQSHPGFIYRIGWQNATRHPWPGDIGYAEKHQHHFVVSGELIDRDGVLWVPSIDGNSGAAPGIVAEHERSLKEPDVFYYSIGRLVTAKLKADAALKALEKSDADPAPPPFKVIE